MANKKDNKEKECLEKTEYGDIVKNTRLIKRTLMVSAFPALVKETKKNIDIKINNIFLFINFIHLYQ